MKTTNYLVLIVGILLLSAINTQAQIKIGGDPITINPSSILEVESDDKGVLLPRVALQSTILPEPLAEHVAGMIIYNTATAGEAPNNVVPGFYYNDGTRWKITSQPGATGPAGADGKSAFEEWQNIVGNENKLLSDFLASIKGDTGAAGTDGVGGVSNAGTGIQITGSGSVSAPYVISTNTAEITLDGEVTGTADATVIANDAVTTDKILDASVTPAKIEKGADNTVLVTDATGAVAWLAKDGFGAVADDETITGAGTTASPFKVENSGITAIELADDAVETAKIKGAAVTPAKIEKGENNTVLTTNASGEVTWLTASNTLTAVDGKLVSTVNGIESTPEVDVLISADNGLTVTDGNVQLGGALTKATTIATDDSNTLAITGLEAGANTDKMLVVNSSGVVKSVDASARNINAIVTVDAAYAVVDEDFTILADLEDGAFTITIPEAEEANKGRILIIRKIDETNNVLTISELIKISKTSSFTTLNYLKTIRIQSNGEDWYQID